jgi:predicted SnoaL-like aldol condensation-catalyzing enzyme
MEAEKERLERNKTNVMKFYAMLFNDNEVAKAMELYTGAEYIQHNPMLPDGHQPVIDYFDRMAKEYPGKRVVFHRAIAENDFVVLHCQQFWPNDDEWAGIDIFRLDADGKVVEHWDCLQRVPKESMNNNTVF